MNAKTTLTLICTALLFFGCSSYQPIGSLTMVSTRNIDSKTQYTELQRGVEGKARLKSSNAIQDAIDQAVNAVPGGEYMMNVRVFVKSNGKFVKVIGDIFGKQTTEKKITTTVTKDIELKVGDKVIFKTGAGLITGKIIGINANTAIVEYPDLFGKPHKKEVAFDKLTKTE